MGNCRSWTRPRRSRSPQGSRTPEVEHENEDDDDDDDDGDEEEEEDDDEDDDEEGNLHLVSGQTATSANQAGNAIFFDIWETRCASRCVL